MASGTYGSLPSQFIKFYARSTRNVNVNKISSASKGRKKLAGSVGPTKQGKDNKKFAKTNKKPQSSILKTNYHFGNYGGLKELELRNKEIAASLVNKITSFDDLKILPNVRQAMIKAIKDESILKNKELDNSETETKTSKEVVPSPIQAVAIKKISKTLMNNSLQSHIIAAETGSGKTMSYLIPLIDFLKREETERPDVWESQVKNKAVIRSVILVPTHELMEQVYQTVMKTEKLLDLHCCKWDMNLSYDELIEAIKSRVDILITTPPKITNLFNIRKISRPDRILSQLKFAVLDEADTLLDKSWLEETHAAIRKLPNLNHLIFCSATIPVEFNKTIGRLFPNVESIITPRLHKLPRSLQFKVIDSTLNPFKGSKIKTLAQTLYAINNDNTEPGYQKKCLVFVNEKKDVPDLVSKLKGIYGHDCVGLTGEDSLDKRIESIKDFVNPSVALPKADAKTGISAETTKQQEITIPGSNIKIPERTETPVAKDAISKLKVLVTTDLMARGLNFRGVRNLVLFDVPNSAIDLVHRVGRTARMNQSGRVFMIIDKKTKSWAKGLPKAVKNNQTIS
ncbi:hypothetical protein TPHA_0J02440 [Tetrapisispora phaffii CBS 4417]|uniref:RNA helicase n=1 Tax=Tetrapisispora phaffii (strain ATCC 24235 / CBS 4417 / NBRC 1672 / NRRL Y-8282 / UCD 70-5) TaxID=1071381 RepID=G8BYX2_TETPH|nr:hypothetical protein TPHA_0J02440 [Tetrapisispora phaffii CBS 4417]CCE65064.1 hypothetical protein TPHA_0J02440 [Tetrapisispora phaffii CBS 4417]